MLLVLVTVLRIAVSNPIEVVGFLYVVPISLAAVEFGWRGGAAAAAAAIALTTFWAVLQEVQLGAIGFPIRAAMFGGVGVLVGLQADQRRSLLAERERLVDELRATSMRDQLTGLANRRAWDERFRHKLRIASRSQAPLSVAVVDLDGLKHVNDTAGHADGDRLLQRCAHAWIEATREADFLARLGGDELFLLLPHCATPDAQEVAQRMLDSVSPEATFSIGIATWDRNESGEDLIARADHAMYAAKSNGGHQMSFAPARISPAARAV